MFVTLRDFKERRHYPQDDPRYPATDHLRQRHRRHPSAVDRGSARSADDGARPVAGVRPSVRRAASSFILEDRADNGLEALEKTGQQPHRRQPQAAARPQDPPLTPAETAAAGKLKGLFTVFRANSPQLYVELNRDTVPDDGRHPSDVFSTFAGLSWLLLRQRLQPLRPHLAGRRPGRGPVPQRPRTRSTS